MRNIPGKILKHIVCEIDINPKYDGYQRGLASMVYNFFDKKTGSEASVKKEVAQELHKSLI